MNSLANASPASMMRVPQQICGLKLARRPSGAPLWPRRSESRRRVLAKPVSFYNEEFRTPLIEDACGELALDEHESSA